MVDALIILDGAADACGTLHAAHTPALDALGPHTLRRPTPAGLPPGSETGIPTLLGAPPAAPVSRGLVEAAAAGIHVPAGLRAWRLDLHHADGRRACAADAALLRPVLARRLRRHAVHHLRGHRLLAVGAAAPPTGEVAGLRTHVWGDGAPLPRVLDDRTVVVCAPGAAAGCAALLGARVVVPPGATGDVDSDLAAKVAAAQAALGDAGRVVVHVGAPDEAAHRLDPAGKRAAVERADREVVAPLAAAVLARGGRITVTADHATCPRTGRHGAGPVPSVTAGAGVLA